MGTGVLGLGSGQAASLNQELIDTLKEAETTARITPLETALEDWDVEKETLDTIIAKANELLESIKPFDLFITGGDTNTFDQKSATTTGSSVVFDAVDVGSLNTGETTVEITALAKRDVFQTNTFTDSSLDISSSDSDILTISHNNIDYDFSLKNKSYDELASEINKNTYINATVEDVGNDNFRIVIKSAESGVDNELDISQAGAVDLGLEDTLNHTLTRSNMEASIDGVSYSQNSNVITVDGGLKITAVELGSSSINVNKDTSAISTGLDSFVEMYNDLVALVDEELYSADSKVEDKASLRSMMNSIKDKLFGNYGENSNLNIFNYGFELDKSGYLSIDSAKITDAIENDYDNLKALLMGSAENEGLGTQLKTLVDSLDGFEGILYSYETSMDIRKTTIEETKEKAVESLDSKYTQLSAQFAAYGTIINQFETSFSGLKLFIEQSTSS